MDLRSVSCRSVAFFLYPLTTRLAFQPQRRCLQADPTVIGSCVNPLGRVREWGNEGLDQMRLIHKLRADGYTQTKIMREVGVSRALVRRVLDIDPEQIPDTAFEQG